MIALTAREQAALNRAAAILEKIAAYDAGPGFSNPDDVKRFLQIRLANRQREYFLALYLDTRHRLIACCELFSGTVDSASVYPREIVKEALRLNASAVILAHNHPSGVAEPSQADIRITRRIVDACGLVDIRVLDHVIVGQACATSMAEQGLV